MIYKTTSYKTIISKVGRDFGLTGANWIPNAIEWLGEGLDAIGHHVGLEKKSCKLRSFNHRVAYPCGHESTLFLEYRAQKLPRGGSHSYGKFEQTPFSQGNGFNDNAFPLVTDGVTTDTTIQIINNAFGQYYLENPDYIITSFECDEFILHYQAYLLDEEGFPKIPDSNYHREALAFYILYKYLSRGNKHPVWDIKSALGMWNDYRGKAQNRAMFPDIGHMDRFKHMWCRIVFDHNLPNQFFRTSEDTQSIYNI